MVCEKQTSHVFGVFQVDKPGFDAKQHWICNKPGEVCMGSHAASCHQAMLG